MTQQTAQIHAFPTATHDTLLQWWLQGTAPAARLHLAWLAGLADAMQFEAQCLHAMAESGERMAGCYRDGETLADPAQLQRCYQRFVEDIAETQWKRLEKASALSLDFRKRLWEEI